MIASHLRAGDVAVLLVLVLALAGPVYGVLVLVLGKPRRSPLGKLSTRVATAVVVRNVSRSIDRVGRGFRSWN